VAQAFLPALAPVDGQVARITKAANLCGLRRFFTPLSLTAES
jgi:hypothetical protein